PVRGGGCVAPVPASSHICPSAMRHLSSLSDQLLVSESPTDYVTHCEHEELNVRHIAVIEPKRLLVHIPEQMERLDRNVGSVEAPLQERPEILKPVRVNVSLDISYSVADYLLLAV